MRSKSVVLFAFCIALLCTFALAAAAQENEGEDAAGEPGRAGEGSAESGGSGAPGPSGAPGQVITPAPPPPPVPARTQTPATTSPTPTWDITFEPVETTQSSDTAQRTGRSWALPIVAAVGILAGAGLVIWSWRRGLTR